MTKTAFPSFRPSVHGRSLIELMVAMLIGSLVLAGVLIITSSSTTIGKRADSLGGLTDNGQTALQLLAADVRMAGYSLPRTYYATGYFTKMMSTAGVRGCDAGFTDPKVAALNSLTCKTGVSSSGGALSLSYEADEYNSVLVKNNGVTTPSDCRGHGLEPIGGMKGNTDRPGVARDSMSETPVYWRVENRYYIANSGPDNEPSLMCVGNGDVSSTQTWTDAVALVRGVERMVVTYGVARGTIDASKNPNIVIITDPSVAAYMTANAIDTNADWAGEATDVRWQRVVSIRVCLETRGDLGSAEQIGGQNPRFTNCDGVSTAIADTRARRAVRMTMNLRNRTMSVDSAQGLGWGGV